MLFDYLEKCLLKIEINDVYDKKQIVYFPKYPVFDSLSANLKNTIMEVVARKTQREKIVSLISYQESTTKKIESSYTLLKMENITE